MFGFNYRNEDFIDYICQKTGKMYVRDHLKAKFKGLYEIVGAHAVMAFFMCEIDEDLQEALVDYAINVYAPDAMEKNYNEYKSL